MLTFEDIERAYKEWYCVSCANSNEEPVSFEIYQRRIPNDIIRDIIKLLDEGKVPLSRASQRSTVNN